MATETSDNLTSHKGPGGRTTPVLVPQGTLAGQPDVPLDRPITTVGSNENARLHLVSRTVSKGHAVFVNSGGTTYVADMASRTGVLVNGKLVKDAELKTGDRVQIGKFVFRYRTPSNAGALPPQPQAPAASVIVVGSPARPVNSRTVMIGRRENSDITFDTDAAVSAAHSVIFQMNGDWHIRDLGSRTGTNVNGKAVVQQQLKFGDRITIGASTILFQPGAAHVEDADESGVSDSTPHLSMDDSIADADIQMPAQDHAVELASKPLDSTNEEPIPFELGGLTEPELTSPELEAPEASSEPGHFESVSNATFNSDTSKAEEESDQLELEPFELESETETVEDLIPQTGSAKAPETLTSEIEDQLENLEPSGALEELAADFTSVPSLGSNNSSAVESGTPAAIDGNGQEKAASPLEPGEHAEWFEEETTHPVSDAAEPFGSFSEPAQSRVITDDHSVSENAASSGPIQEPVQGLEELAWAEDEPSPHGDPMESDSTAKPASHLAAEATNVPTGEPAQEGFVQASNPVEALEKITEIAEQPAFVASENLVHEPAHIDAVETEEIPFAVKPAELRPDSRDESVPSPGEDVPGQYAVNNLEFLEQDTPSDAVEPIVVTSEDSPTSDLAQELQRSDKPSAEAENFEPVDSDPSLEQSSQLPDGPSAVEATPIDLQPSSVTDNPIAEQASIDTLQSPAVQVTPAALVPRSAFIPPPVDLLSNVEDFVFVPIDEKADPNAVPDVIFWGDPELDAAAEQVVVEQTSAQQVSAGQTSATTPVSEIPTSDTASVVDQSKPASDSDGFSSDDDFGSPPTEPQSPPIAPSPASLSPTEAIEEIEPSLEHPTESHFESTTEVKAHLEPASADVSNDLALSDSVLPQIRESEAANEVAPLVTAHEPAEANGFFEAVEIVAADETPDEIFPLPLPNEVVGQSILASEAVEPGLNFVQSFDRILKQPTTPELSVNTESAALASPEASISGMAEFQEPTPLAPDELPELQLAHPQDVELNKAEHSLTPQSIEPDAESIARSTVTESITEIAADQYVESAPLPVPNFDDELPPAGLNETRELDDPDFSELEPDGNPTNEVLAAGEWQANVSATNEPDVRFPESIDLKSSTLAEIAMPLPDVTAVEQTGVKEFESLEPEQSNVAPPEVEQSTIETEISEEIAVTETPQAALAAGAGFLPETPAVVEFEPEDNVTEELQATPDDAAAVENAVEFSIGDDNRLNDEVQSDATTAEVNSVIGDTDLQHATASDLQFDLSSDAAATIDAPHITSLATPALQETLVEVAPLLESPGDITANTTPVSHPLDISGNTHSAGPAQSDLDDEPTITLTEEWQPEVVLPAAINTAGETAAAVDAGDESDLEFLDFDEPMLDEDASPVAEGLETSHEKATEPEHIPQADATSDADGIDPSSFEKSAASIDEVTDDSSALQSDSSASVTDSTVSDDVTPPLDVTPVKPSQRKPSLFGFEFEGGSFLGGMPISLDRNAPSSVSPLPEASVPALPPSAKQVSADLSIPSTASAVISTATAVSSAVSAVTTAASVAASAVTNSVGSGAGITTVLSGSVARVVESIASGIETDAPVPVTPIVAPIVVPKAGPNFDSRVTSPSGLGGMLSTQGAATINPPRPRPAVPPAVNRPTVSGASLTGLVSEAREAWQAPVIPPVVRKSNPKAPVNPSAPRPGLTGAAQIPGAASRNVEVFSQLAAPIGVEVFGGRPGNPEQFVVPDSDAAAADTTLDQEGSPAVAAPSDIVTAPATPPAARKARRSRLPILVPILIAIPMILWVAVNRYVPISSMLVGRLAFVGLAAQQPVDAHEFMKSQEALIYSDDIRAHAQANLEKAGRPAAFTADHEQYAQIVNAQNVTWNQNAIELSYNTSDQPAGKAQVDAVLAALAERDRDLDTLKDRAKQEADEAQNKVTELNQTIASFTQERRVQTNVAQDRPDQSLVGETTNDVARYSQQYKDAVAVRQFTESILTELKKEDTTKPIDPENDPQVVDLKRQIQSINDQINRAKAAGISPSSTATIGTDVSVGATTQPEFTPDPLIGALQQKADQLTGQMQRRKEDLASKALIPADQRAVDKAAKVESFTIKVTGQRENEAALKKLLDEATTKLKAQQDKQNAAKMAEIASESLYQKILDARAELQTAANTQAAKEAAYSNCVTTSSKKPQVTVASVTNPRMPIFAALAILSSAVLGLMIIGELVRPKVVAGVRPAAAPLVSPPVRMVPWPQPQQLKGLETPAATNVNSDAEHMMGV